MPLFTSSSVVRSGLRKSNRRRAGQALAVAVSLAALQQAGGQTLYWDGDGAGVVGGGAGTWNLTLQRWSTTAAGSTYQVWNNASNNDAVFANTAGVVTVADSIIAKSISLNTTAYTLSGGTLAFGAGGGTVSVVASGSGTITSVITGSVGLTKVGTGSLLLLGSNTYSGVTTINAGIIQATTNGAFGTNDIAVALTSAGIGGFRLGTITVNNNISFTAGTGTNGFQTNSGSFTTLNGLISGAGNININPNTGSGTVLFNNPSSTFTGSLYVTNGTLGVGANAPASGIGALGNSASALSLQSAGATSSAIIATAGVTVARPINVVVTSVTAGTASYIGGTGAGVATFSGAISLPTSQTNTSPASGTFNFTSAPGNTTRFTNAISGNLSTAVNYFTGNGTTTVTIQSPLTTGTIVLSGTNTYAGIVRVPNGTLSLNSATALGAVGGGIAVQATGAAAVLDPGTDTSFAETASMFFTGRGLLGQGALINKTGNNTLAAPLVLNETSGTSINVFAGTTLSLLSTGGLTATGQNAALADFIKLGDGTLSVASFSAATGTTFFRGAAVVNAGTLQINSISTFGGGLAGSGGTLTANDTGVLRYFGSTGSGSLSLVSSLNRGGTLFLDNSNNSNANRLADTAAIITNGGVFTLSGSTTAALVETVGFFNANSGASTIAVQPAVGFAAAINAGSFTRTTGSTVLFRGTNLGQPAAAGVANITFNDASGLTLVGAGGAAATTTMSIVPFATGATTGTGSGTDFVTVSAGVVRPLASSEYATSIADGTTTADNVKLASSAVVDQATVVNSVIAPVAGTTLSGVGTLTVTSGAVFLPSTSAGSSVSVAGLDFGAAEGVVTNNVNASISSAITGSSGVIKSGTGRLTLTGTSTFTGPLTVAAGTLAFTAAESLGATTSALNIAGGVVDLSGAVESLPSTKTIGIGAAGGTLNVAASETFTINGAIGAANSQVGRLNKIGGGTVVLNGTNGFGGSGAYTGLFLLDGYTVASSDAALGASGGTVTLNGGSLVFNNGVSITRPVSLIGVSNFVVDSGNSGTLGILYNGAGFLGDIAKNGGGELFMTGNNNYYGRNIVNGGTLTYTASNNTGFTPLYFVADNYLINNGALKTTAAGFNFAAARGFTVTGSAIIDSSVASGTLGIQGVISGAGSLTKTGAAILSLQASNTYTGNTVISAGTLALGATGAIPSTPSITLKSGTGFDVSLVTGGFKLLSTQTLAGTGTVTGSFTAQGTVAPGEAAIGSLSFSGGLTLASTATYSVKIAGDTGAGVAGGNDVIAITASTLSLGNAALQVLPLAGYSSAFHFGQTYRIADYAGLAVIPDVFAGLAEGATLTTPAGSFTISYVGGDGNDVFLTAVPEPTTLGLLGLAGFGLMRRRRVAK